MGIRFPVWMAETALEYLIAGAAQTAGEELVSRLAKALNKRLKTEEEQKPRKRKKKAHSDCGPVEAHFLD